MIYPDLNQEIPHELGRVHFVGIGGSGMSGIARMMREAGVVVSGSDRSETYTTRGLRDEGIEIAIGHSAEHAQGADTLVVTGALWEDNPEYQYALAHDIPVLHRSQALAWLARNKRLVSVAGAHGKTTTTGMIVTGLLALDQSPSFVNGGVIEALGTSSLSGNDPLMVIEADESDRSFLLYDSAIALITNVDPEHLDFYGSREAFMQAFVDFAEAASELVVLSSDDPGAAEVRHALKRDTILTFGEAEDADVRISEIDTREAVRFRVTVNGESWPVQLGVYGHHNAHNAAGAIAVLIALGHDARSAAEAVATFGGTKRRFEFHANIGGVRVYDDYAHHPTEVQALLRSARAVSGSGRLIAVHQPHLYSRTRLFCQEFADVLETEADFTLVLAVDGAREDPVPGVTGELVSEKFQDPARVRYIPDWQNAADFLGEFAAPGDVMVTMSCGTVYQIIPQIEAALRERFGDQ
jgi:UDP-N-acetylmuramate--alanine ligase